MNIFYSVSVCLCACNGCAYVCVYIVLLIYSPKCTSTHLKD